MSHNRVTMVNDDFNFSTLEADKLSQTIERLSVRVSERFPGSGLSNVCTHLLGVSQDAKARSIKIAQPISGLRLVTTLLIAFIIVGLIGLCAFLQKPTSNLNIAEFVQLFEAAINDVILIGLAILFLTTVETRIKRRRALKAIHELRAIAHIIDMHQLTKDPDAVAFQQEHASLHPSLTSFQMGRYLDYCSQMLSLTGKIAALYTQHFDDAVALASVNEIETLTTGLSNKIWQKIDILHYVAAEKRTVETRITAGESNPAVAP